MISLLLLQIIWLLFLTSEKNSLFSHLLNSFSHATLTHPSGSKSIVPSGSSQHPGSHRAGGGRTSSIAEINPSRSHSGLGQNSIGGSGYYPPVNGSQVKLNGGNDLGKEGLMGGHGADVERGDASRGVGSTGPQSDGGYHMKAKAMYACESTVLPLASSLQTSLIPVVLDLSCSPDQASADDPQEMSFTKGELLDISDNSGTSRLLFPKLQRDTPDLPC